MNNKLDVEQVLATLAEMHNGVVAPQVEKNIRQWAGFFGTAAIKSVLLLELSNLDVLANLLADPQIGKHLSVIEGSSKPLAMVDPEHADAVRAVLVERGVVVAS